MELLLFVLALCALDVLSMAFGADSRPTPGSDEERLARHGVAWDLLRPGDWRSVP
jgi:hypothetical protein